MSSINEKGKQENFEIRIRPITLGVEIELEEPINLRGYECGDKVFTKTRRTTWHVIKTLTIDEVLKLCKDESVFNEDYGRRMV